MNQHRAAVRQLAMNMRQHGESYTIISTKLKVPKSTLSHWLKDIPLSDEDRARLYTARIRNMALGASSSKERRRRQVAAIIESARKDVPTEMTLDTFRLFGAALYWAEGTKKGQLEITNSDPLLIAHMVRWFVEMFGVGRRSLKARLNIYSQQDENEIKRFWSELTGIPLSNFGKSYIKPVSKDYKKNVLYYGTIKITVPRSTDLKHRVFGWIEGALGEEARRTQMVRRRWEQLEKVERAVNLRYDGVTRP